MRPVYGGSKEVPCNCALRSVFRACYARFRSCAASQGHAGAVQWEHLGNGKEAHRTYGRKNEEYMADFCTVSNHALDPLERKLFTLSLLAGRRLEAVQQASWPTLRREQTQADVFLPVPCH